MKKIVASFLSYCLLLLMALLSNLTLSLMRYVLGFLSESHVYPQQFRSVATSLECMHWIRLKTLSKPQTISAHEPIQATSEDTQNKPEQSVQVSRVTNLCRPAKTLSCYYCTGHFWTFRPAVFANSGRGGCRSHTRTRQQLDWKLSPRLTLMETLWAV